METIATVISAFWRSVLLPVIISIVSWLLSVLPVFHPDQVLRQTGATRNAHTNDLDIPSPASQVSPEVVSSNSAADRKKASVARFVVFWFYYANPLVLLRNTLARILVNLENQQRRHKNLVAEILKPRPAGSSRVVMEKVVESANADPRGFVLGGPVLKWIDSCAGLSARKHADLPCVTASLDAVHFLLPIKVNDAIIITAQVNRVWRSSMEVGVQVMAENIATGVKRICCQAFLTFVTIQYRAESGIVMKNEAGLPGVESHTRPLPITVPAAPCIPETEAEQLRYRDADFRRQTRVASKRKDYNQSKEERLRPIDLEKLATDGIIKLSEKTDKVKSLFESQTESTSTIMPEHANALGIAFGGHLMDIMNSAATLSAFRHSRSDVSTASVDSCQFLKPVMVGDVVTVIAHVSQVFGSSMEVYVRVHAQRPWGNRGRNENVVPFVTNDAFFTVVAFEKDQKPAILPGLALPLSQEAREKYSSHSVELKSFLSPSDIINRAKDAKQRREVRLKEKAHMK